MSHSLSPADEYLTELQAMLPPFGLLQGLSYELRAPLTAILGWTEWFSDGVTSPEQQQEGIRHIRSAAEKMLQLLDDYGELARFGETEGLATATTDLLVTLRRISQGLELVAQPRRQSLLVEDMAEHVSSLTLSVALRQALWLTLRHVLYVLPEGAIVRVSCKSPGQIVVKSDQTPNEALSTGGLKLARLLVVRAGGALDITPRETGMEITIHLPSPNPATALLARAFPQPSVPVEIPTASLSGTKKVLVIDDDENLLKLLGSVVSAAGYCPYLATSGARGLETARATSPDVVLLDIGMPGMDGFATFNMLRAEPRLAKSKIVALTAYTGAAERERIALHGFDGFIPKPFRREQLIQVLSELLIEQG